ncbi:MAG: hypothetical protein M4579_001723 [Chaenotheca gracillima]|nr:MAG: hypothetical protein M4579_001723 [Chaenotheca gracillima]
MPKLRVTPSLQSPLLRRIQAKRFNGSKPPPPQPTVNLNSPKSLSLSQRLRKLSREYGWSALGVYLLLSALDFPFCFLAVRTLGTERIGHWEHVVVDFARKVVYYPFKSEEEKPVVNEVRTLPSEDDIDSPDRGWGVAEAQERNTASDASIWTQLALAYAIHKSFIFVRVPLTAAVTPKVVRVLRGWGWDIGKRTPKAVKPSPKPTPKPTPKD